MSRCKNVLMRAEEITETVNEMQAAHRTDTPVSVLTAAQRILWLGRSLDSALDRITEAGGLSKRGDYEVLALLYRKAPESVHPKQIARALDLSTSGVTGRLDRLEDLGLLYRSADTEDRRALRVALTDEGSRLTTAIYEHNTNLYTRLLEEISPTDVERLLETLSTIHHNLEQASPPPRRR